MNLNILFIIDVFGFDSPGGAGTTLYEYASRLVNKGHNVFVVSRRINDKIPLRTTINGIHFYMYDNNYKNALLFIITCIYKNLKIFREILRKSSINVISIHHPLPALGLLINRKARYIPKLYSFYAPWHLEYVSHKIPGNVVRLCHKLNIIMRKWVEKKVIKSCKKILSLSKYTSELLSNIHKIDKSLIEIISGGVDTQKFIPPEDRNIIRNKLNIPKDKIILFTVRRLVPRMGLENLIKSMPDVVSKYNNIRLIIGGNGPLADTLKNLTNSMKLENYICFTGFIDNEKLPLFYQASDYFILPTTELEGFGLVTLEALSSGVPVLGTPVGAIKEILGNIGYDLTFAGTDAGSISQLILKHIASYENRDKLSNDCRDFATKNYSWELIMPRVESLFFRLSK